ncbi:branched chain amino acid aminotransferase apoenzyme [Micromonospora viridifaciens]|uniref:Branched-chain-amino-acid aminotransferase n=1 Tax=Micromonospora viridifaciens TaxID=1881 RepID=A0A1C4WUD5_MICVI|nr:branched-chain amino acid transaminase [Micromonospora viridifaciens]SCE99799.1 branched chain amino acid aminotransferase apoenzyme [Micromonospora viridifaciens]
MSDGTVWLDGALVDWDAATVHVSAHGLHYGIGFFEGVRCYGTPQGPAIFRLTDHLRRLERSAKTYLVGLPFGVDDLAEACRSVVRANNLADAYLRPIVFLGPGENPLTAPYRVAVLASANGPLVGGTREAGVRAKVASFQRMPSHVLPPAAKATGQYLNSYLAQMEALTSGYDEAILLNTEGHVTDGWAHNLFVVRDGELLTPHLASGALAGVVRDTVLTLAAEAGIPARADVLLRTDLYHADECFLTGTAAGIVPVLNVDGRPVGAGKVGPVTQQVADRYADLTTGRTSDHPQWRELVG